MYCPRTAPYSVVGLRRKRCPVALDCDGMGSIPASPDARNVPLLLMKLACLLSKTANSGDQVFLPARAGAVGCAGSQPARTRFFLSGVVKTIVWLASWPKNLWFRPQQPGPSTPRDPPWRGCSLFCHLLGCLEPRCCPQLAPRHHHPQNLQFCHSDRPCRLPALLETSPTGAATCVTTVDQLQAARSPDGVWNSHRRATHCN